MKYKIKEVADLVGISVRTLHHYDEIGLLKPQTVPSNGYRIYTKNDLERLQQILFFRELDFSLQEIKAFLDNPSFDRVKTLELHKELLVKKKKRLENIIDSVEKTIESIEGGKEMSRNEMFNSFDMTEIEKHKEKYAEETKQKYGDSHAYKESMRRTSKYSKDDWANIMGNANEIYLKIANLMDENPANQQVQEAVGEWRQHITDYFYDCTPEIFRGLGDLYVTDERFTKNIDKIKEGLAQFLKEAMDIYCDNLE